MFQRFRFYNLSFNAYILMKKIQNFQKKKTVRQRHQNLLKEKENKRQKTAGERYQNFTEEEKKMCNKNLSEEQKLIKYRRNYYLTYNK